MKWTGYKAAHAKEFRATMLISSRHELFVQSPSPSPGGDRRLPLLNRRSGTSSSSSFSSPRGSDPKSSPLSCSSARVGEIVGGTTAECAAVFCCCPCGLINLLVLVVYKVPAGLFRQAVRKRRKEKLTKKGLHPAKTVKRSNGEEEVIVYDLWEESDAVKKLEREMWETFSGAGFWRSSSQREPLFQDQVVVRTGIPCVSTTSCT